MTKSSPFDRTMLLKLFIANNELREKYLDAVVEHNNKLDSEQYPDSGFDLYLPEDTKFRFGETHLVDLGVKCAACWLDEDNYIANPTAFSVFARSSIGKHCLRLANNVGIIDSGYRGNLMAMVDCIRGLGKGLDTSEMDDYSVEKHTRLFQICSPTLGKVRVIIVGSENDLGTSSRGEGGFGSTGR